MSLKARAADAFSQFELTAGAPVIVAVSGGGDSMALLHLFGAWAERGAPSVPLIAATVDHGLRPESAAEARAVGRACAVLGIDHHSLRWNSGAGGPGLQARARTARHDLLSGLARETGARLVLTGHTADDQAETVAMRRARRATGPGLAGIDVASLYDRTIWFARPLLDLRRAELRDWLMARDIAFIEDPSNRDHRFERVRVRAALAGDDQTHRDLIAIAGEARAARAAAAIAGAACLDDRAVWRRTGQGIVFDPANAHARYDVDALGVALASVLAQVGRRPRMPDSDRVDAALAFALSAANATAYTVSGCRLSKSEGVVTIAAEARNRRDGASCFETLLPLADWPLAQAVMRCVGAPELPLSPLRPKKARSPRKCPLVAVS